MKVISLNANGIRAAAKKGLFNWIQKEDPDVLCLQETKAHEAQLSDELFNPKGYFRYFFSAEKKGYSGVAIYTKRKPDQIKMGLGFDLSDKEGRYIQCDFGSLSIGSLYLPSGSSGPERQGAKFKFLDLYGQILKDQKDSGRSYILCGDWNIVHKEIDIKNFKANQKNSGCLPEERAWLDKLITQDGWVDAFRVTNQEKDQYTWWTARSYQAWLNNVGWRIDYQIITPDLKDKVRQVSIYKTERFSDHAPVMIEYEKV